MTKTEFDEWINYHCQAFPKLREDFESNLRSLAQWFNALKRVRLKSAKEATDEMLGDGVKFGEHVATVKTYAKKHRGIEGEAEAPTKRYIDGERVYTCIACQDSGHNYVFGPRAMLAMKEERYHWLGSRDLVICACDCEWGRKVGFVQKLVGFDRTKLVRWDGDDRDAVERLAAFYGLPMPELIRPEPYVRPVHVQTVEQTAPEKPLASLLAASKSIQPVVAQASDGRVYDESEASVEGPWTPDMDIPF